MSSPVGPLAEHTIADSHRLVEGVRLAVSDHGTGAPVVLVHGTPSHSYLWRGVAPQLQRAGHRVVAYDLLGYGLSERPLDRDTSVTAQAGLLAGLLDVLDISSAAVVGHDIGGAVAQVLAVGAPQRVSSLLVVDTVSFDSWPSATWRTVIDDNADQRYVRDEAAFTSMLSTQLQATVTRPMTCEILAAYLAPHRGRRGRASFFDHQVRHYDSAHTQVLTPRLPALPMPVHLLWGRDDRWQPVAYAEKLHELVPDSTLTVTDGGHFLPEDDPRGVAQWALNHLPG